MGNWAKRPRDHAALADNPLGNSRARPHCLGTDRSGKRTKLRKLLAELFFIKDFFQLFAVTP